MPRLILTEQEKSNIRNLYNIQEQENDFVYWYEEGRSAGQPIFDYIRGKEGFVPFVYDDKAGYPPKPYDPNSGKPKGKLTIGYGTTNPEIIKKYLNKMSQEEALKLSAEDINNAAECVKRWQKSVKEGDKNGRKLTKGMYMAMIDLAYNMGCSGLRNSKLISDIESGNYSAAADKIENGDWGHDSRRKETRELFCKNGVC